MTALLALLFLATGLCLVLAAARRGHRRARRTGATTRAQLRTLITEQEAAAAAIGVGMVTAALLALAVLAVTG